MEIRVAPDAIGAAEAAARSIATRLRNAVRDRGRASLALSGGGTPALMFDALARLPVPWSSIDVLQVDERAAPEGSPHRNATQLRERLLGALTTHRPRVHLLPVDQPDRAAPLRSVCATIAQLAPLDVVHLGIGDDGHTASWPPGDDILRDPRPVAWTRVFNGFERMTLTEGPVNGARSRVVLVTGSAKSGAVARWVAGDPALPISAVRRARTSAFLDDAAASDLDGAVAQIR